MIKSRGVKMKYVKVTSDNLHEVKQSLDESIAAIGFFDGLHKGHQSVIQKAKEEAIKRKLKVSVISFYPHPKVCLQNDAEFSYIMTLDEKKRLLAEWGIHQFIVIEFTKTFAQTSPKEFVTHYLMPLKIQHLVCGYDFNFGYKGQGKPEHVEHFSNDQITVHVVEQLSLEGEKISSTSIRKCLVKGEVSKVNQMLGRIYEPTYQYG